MSLLDLVPSIAGGALDLWGQERTNKQNRDIAQQTNAANTNIAREQMAFQERMSSSAWQRGVADMKAAGINPMLAVSQGGASSPAGAAVGAVTGAPMQNSAGRGVASAMALKQLQSQLSLNEALTHAANKDAELKSSNANLVKANTDLAKTQLPGAKNAAAIEGSAFGFGARALGTLSNYVATAKALAHIGGMKWLPSHYGTFNKKTGAIHR